MYEAWLDVLQNTPLFQGISRSELAAMLSCLQPRLVKHRKNEFIALAGDRFDGIGILLSGTATITKENAAGTRAVITCIEPGELFGEIAAFSGQTTWPASVIAQDNCTAIFLPPAKLIGECERMCVSHRSLIANMLKVVSTRALTLNRKVDYLVMKSLRGKISNLLLEQYRRAGSHTFLLPLKRNELADFFNVARPSLSRELGQMRDEGLIDFHSATVKLKDVPALQRIAEEN